MARKENAEAVGAIDGIELITRADDFGVSPGTNDAIIDAVTSGFIRNVGLMAVGPYIDYRLDELITLTDQCCLGVHATLNSEWATHRWGPLLGANGAASLMRKDGSLYPSTMETIEYGLFDEMINEIKAQLDYLRQRKVPVGYLDTHMNFDWVSGMSRALENMCRDEALVYGNSDDYNVFRLESGDYWAEASPHLIVESIEASLKQAWLAIFHPAYQDGVIDRFWKDSESGVRDEAYYRTREAFMLNDPAFQKVFIESPLIHISRFDEVRSHLIDSTSS